MNSLVELLDKSADLYKSFLELEYKKYDTVIKDDIKALDDIVAKEQVYYLKMRGIEQKRERLVDSMGYKDKTLMEIINAAEGNDKNILIKKHEELSEIVNEVKKISSLCKTLIEVRMHRIDKAMSQLGEKENTYSNVQLKGGKADSLVLFRKI